MRSSVLVVLCIFLITGCAAYRPVVDLKGVDWNRYETDLRECQYYAEQVSPAAQAAAGAGLGAALGAVLGVAVGVALNVDVGELAGLGAAAGGVQGAATGGAHGAGSQVEIIKNCMAGRGYKVLH